MAVSLPKLPGMQKLSREQVIVRAIMLGSLGIVLFTIASGVQSGAFGHGAGARSVDGGVLALSSDGREIAVLSPFDGELLGIIELEHEASRITPTPGGVSVFVSFVGRDELRVYSTTEYELQETISFDGRVPEHLLFSENGETLFVSYLDVPVISVFNHSMRTLDLSFEFELAGSYGPVYRNRRATRLYRATPDGLAVVFAANGEVIETLAVSAAELGFNRDYSHIWALESDQRPATSISLRQVSTTGVPLLIEERTGSTRRVETMVRTGPVFASEQGQVSALGQAAFLSAVGDQVLFFDSRSGEQESVLELPFAAELLIDSGVGTLWALESEGRLAVIDPARGSVRQVESGRGTAGAAGTASAVESGRGYLAGARVVIDSVEQAGGSFACF